MGFISRLFHKPKNKPPSHVPVSEKAPDAPADAQGHPYRELKRQGSELLDKGKPEEALPVYEAAARESPQLAEAHINLGYVLNELGRTAEAKARYALALTLDPANFDAYLLLAQLAYAENDLEDALSAAQSALQLRPNSDEAKACFFKTCALQDNFGGIEAFIQGNPELAPTPAEFHLATGNVLANLPIEGPQKDKAIELAFSHIRKAIALAPESPQALVNLGLLWVNKGKHEQSMPCFQQALAIQPDFADAHYYLAIGHKSLGDMGSAKKLIQSALAADPEHVPARNMLAYIHGEEGNFPDAVRAYEASLAIDPEARSTRIMLARLFIAASMHAQAQALCAELVEKHPDDFEVVFTFANMYLAQGNYPQAIENLQRALRLKPSSESVLINLGAAFLGRGEHARAMESWHAALAENPQSLTTLSNIVYGATFDASCSPADYLGHARNYGAAATARAVTPYQDWVQAPLAGRSLRVGLVSGDFGLHPVGYFLEGILSQLDPEIVELHAFSNQASMDPLQTSLKSRVASWTSIVGLDDTAAAKAIHGAHLDLLIDLSGHTGLNRLPLFALRPAPVQATWLGFWGSTGVAEIDYILVDEQSVPLAHRSHFSEQPWYLPDTRLCFTPPTAVYDHAPSPLPALKNGYCTFGSYQPVRKLSASVFQVWGKIFAQIPNARLRLQGSKFTEPQVRDMLLRRLADAGIAPERVTLHPMAQRLEYLKSHGEVDLLLDSFPYPGGTTSCDALWMGVPTVTLAGNSMLSRQGASLMTCAGLPDWVAYDEDEYVAIAVAKAMDITGLSQLRANLRQQVFVSPLFDAPRFARNLEASLLAMVQDKSTRLRRPGHA